MEVKAVAFFRAYITITVGDIIQTKFCTDRWFNGRSFEDPPHLLAVVSVRAKRNRTVVQVLVNWAWIRDITGGLTIPDIASYLLLWDRLENAHL